MSKKLPDWIKFPLVLFIVATIAAVSLAALNSVTLPKKLAMQQAEMEKALKVVMPTADSFEASEGSDGFKYMKALKGGDIVGYTAVGSASGYSSVLRVMVGVDKNFVIQGIKVLYQKETPGLGDKVEEVLSQKTWGTIIAGTSPDEKDLRPWFQVQFDGKSAPVKVKKYGGDIEAITGATISSRAVCLAVNEAVEKLRQSINS